MSHPLYARKKGGAFLDTDESGKLIDNPSKGSKSVEVDGDGRFCGHRFALKGKIYGDKRCLYCGKWFHWHVTEAKMMKWIKENNIDTLNADNNIEPLHCESGHCEDYHERCRIADMKKMAEYQERVDKIHFKLFKNLKTRKLL